MDFQKENIFESKEINEICDFIFEKVEAIYKKSEAMIICGSVAKICSGILPKNYPAKDLDFVVQDYFVWRFLKENLQQWFPQFEVEVREKERVILFTNENRHRILGRRQQIFYAEFNKKYSIYQLWQ